MVISAICFYKLFHILFGLLKILGIGMLCSLLHRLLHLSRMVRAALRHFSHHRQQCGVDSPLHSENTDDLIIRRERRPCIRKSRIGML